MRIRFRLQPPDAKTESLAFQIGQVPDLFHGRERASRAGRLCLFQRERLERLAKERLRRRERFHQFVPLNLSELHVLHVASLIRVMPNVLVNGGVARQQTRARCWRPVRSTYSYAACVSISMRLGTT